ncbi:MAG: ABC transporter [Clostridiales bacterium]|nr:ATP-binding cassette domain-containing protein [Bacillota bacterium]MEE0516518.1 ATP-binding cassette domain-containing protein [Anaerovoracaceae bacterium]PWL94209.1 MAG: ABC transporter [Clostridiales bacterium]
MIELKHLSKVYDNGKTKVEAIKDINLTIEDGDIFGIIGLSGAGKSTLIRCVNFLEEPTSGQVIFDGVDLGTISHKELLKKRQSMSMIFQNFNLLSQRTALGNICYPLEIAGVDKKKAKEKARKLLDIVGLSEKENAYPVQLSGGQKQRIAIARALATDPKVLLCDEATSALDPTTTASILNLLKEINKTMGVTIIIITHEMKVIEQICNKVAVIDNSNIVEEGLVKDVFTAPKSHIAKQLILPKNEGVPEADGFRCLRLVFDGTSAFEPIISALSRQCSVDVNILGANTKNIEGVAYGQMLIQMPEDEQKVADIKAFLDSKKVKYKEEGLNV